MAIHHLDTGGCVISSRGMWLPGVYEDERAALRAFTHSDAALQHLQDMANARGGLQFITMEDLREAEKRNE